MALKSDLMIGDVKIINGQMDSVKLLRGDRFLEEEEESAGTHEIELIDESFNPEVIFASADIIEPGECSAVTNYLRYLSNTYADFIKQKNECLGGEIFKRRSKSKKRGFSGNKVYQRKYKPRSQ